MSSELELVIPNENYKEQVMNYLEEHIQNGEYELHGDGGLDHLKDYDKWLLKIRSDMKVNSDKEIVPSTLYLAIRKNDNRLVGMIQIRHKLNETLLKKYGHIGDGVRPSERKKGYSTEMIKLALEKCKLLNIHKVLITCDKNNVASARTIIKNGGVLENEIEEENGNIIQRYWIDN